MLISREPMKRKIKIYPQAGLHPVFTPQALQAIADRLPESPTDRFAESRKKLVETPGKPKPTDEQGT